MAAVALVLPRLRFELFVVLVVVTGGTDELAGNVHGVFARGLMALHTVQVDMPSFQGKLALLVSLPIKGRRLVGLLVVTGSTIRPGRARGELAFMGILMAILTTLVGDLLMEIGCFVALGANYFRVLSLQRKLRDAVVETFAGMIVFPAARGVALVAGAAKLGILERAAVRVVVTAVASVRN
jgi:hypothetical protein